MTGPAAHAQDRLLAGLLGDDGMSTPGEVAGRCGVSPAAARETLVALEREGVLERTGDGAFRPARLESSEVRELYPAVLLLESVAVRDAPPYDAATLEELREINARMRASAGDSAEAALADDAFHRRLIAGCGNERLLAVVDPVRRALLRYERVYMLSPNRLARSAAQHDAIVDALQLGDQEAAAELVRRNFTTALPDLTRELDARRDES
jgi:DNA-binding GntR family transcriptional regulator